MENDLKTILTSEKQYIKPKDIDSALLKLLDRQKSPHATRASLFNLVVYTKADYREEYLQKIARKIIRKFPCRMMLITEFEEPGEPYLKTHVSDIQPDSGNQTSWCDIIHFEVNGPHRERLSSVILPHILSDLPVYLLWCDDPSSNRPDSIQLGNLPTRTIFDSETVNHLTHFAKTILSMNDGSDQEIGDLNWARFQPWREVFAQTFNSPESFAHMQDVESIDILYNDLSNKYYSQTRIQATYFQAWLGVKLKWAFDCMLSTKDEICFKYNNKKGPITIQLHPSSHEEVAPGRLLSIILHTRSGTKIEMKRMRDDSNKISIQTTTTDRCDLPIIFLLNRESTARSMANEIYNRGTSTTLLEVLKLIATYKEGVICS